ncbi:MAG TPA: TolC family protein [Bacteroidota bacterium]
MKRIIFSFTIILFTVVLVHRCDAQTGSPPVSMSSQACVQEARKNNAGLRGSVARVAAADAKASEAFSALLPQVRLTSRFAQLSDIDPFSVTAPGLGSLTLFPNIDHSYSARVSVQQLVFSGFRLMNNLDAARLNATATQEGFIRDEHDLILEVKRTYWSLARARHAEEFIRQTVEQVSEHLRDVQNFNKQGLATENDVYKVEVQLADIKLKLIEAESNRRLITMALNNLMGKPLDVAIIPTEDPELTAPPLDTLDMVLNTPSALLNGAREHRPELKATRARKEMSEAGVAMARAGWYPQVALSAGYDYARPNQRIIPPKDRWEGTWDVGLTMQWNLWDWFTTANQVSQAQAAVRQTEAGLEQLENAVAMQVAQHYWTMEAARQKRVVAKKGVGQAMENHRVTNEKFKRGLATNTDLLDAEVALLQSKLNDLQANIDYQIAYANVIHAAGMSYDQAETK